MRLARHTAKWARWGGAVGLLIWLSALWCTGAGHGTFIPITLSGSPLSLIPPIGFLAVPVMWAVIVGLAVAPRTRRNRMLFLGWMTAHYVVATALIIWTPLGDGKYVGVTWNAVPGVVLAWATFYCLGQVLAWGAFLGGVRQPPTERAISS